MGGFQGLGASGLRFRGLGSGSLAGFGELWAWAFQGVWGLGFGV